MKRTFYGHGLAVDDGEKHARGTVRLSPPLFYWDRGHLARKVGEVL
jgi:hypothetical protein